MEKLIVIGPAGSGKSTLSKAFGLWLENEGHAVEYVNLDPGAKYIPYKPTFDVRQFANVEKIMETEGLAPNGALIRASEIMEKSIDSIANCIEKKGRDAGYCIIDTPGQMELFLFRSLGPRLASSLRGKASCIFVMDPCLLKGRTDIIVLKLLDLLVELRLGLPSLEVINKSDLLRPNIFEDFGKGLEKGYEPKGTSAELTDQLNDVVKGLSKRRHAIFVSALRNCGMDDLYKAICESKCSCGDLS